MTGATRTAIAAHRGGAALWPENSPTAFRETARLTVELVEFDVHQTRDGGVVVHHDPTLERTTSGGGAIAAHDWAEVQQVTLNGTDGERIPTLAEVIAIFTGTAIDLRLEIKAGPDFRRYDGLERRVAAILRAHGMLDRTVVTSFLLDTLVTFRRAAVPRRLIWLINPPVLASVGLLRLIGLARDAAIPELGLRADTIGAAAQAACRDAGLALGAWSAHDAPAIRRCLDLGLTTLTTDDPVLALKLRDG